ncbi:hypothetical protein AS188_00455 [Kocuria flava]|uniref:Uncharacterized protein n=1 Tax=Kocuria flava TaxID=446860 RepID=A0A0U3HLK7_9MICC|nr:hypothetical protein AS188_00455 [Kocuria flava]
MLVQSRLVATPPPELTVQSITAGIGSAALFSGAVSIVVALFTTVIFNYLCAPWLEARKDWLKQQYELARDLKGRLANCGATLRMVEQPLKLGSSGFQPMPDPTAARKLTSGEVSLPANMRANRLYPIFTDLAKWAAEVITAHNRRGGGDSALERSAGQLIDLTARLIEAMDPVAFPWSRARALRRAERLHRSLLREGRTPATLPWGRKPRARWRFPRK